MKTRPILLFSSFLLLTGCSIGSGDYRYALKNRGIEPPSDYTAISHCHGYGCKYRTAVGLEKAEWEHITTPFRPGPTTAEAERKAIAETIGRFETVIGDITGTKEDTHGTFKELGDYQLDCVDESVNTTVYLSLLERTGLMTFHSVQPPAERIPLIHYSGYWPHKTAAIVENDTKTLYAVDSWFHDNGHPAEIVTLEEWKSGWKPELRLTNRP